MLRQLLNLVHRKKSNTTLRRKTCLRLEALENRMVPTSVVSYTNLGVIIPNVQVETVYYGQAWTNANDANNPQLTQQAKDLNKFVADITQSSYMTGLNQYRGLANYQWNTWFGPLTIPYAAAPGKGQFLRSDMGGAGLNVTSAAGTTLTDGQIRTMLQQEIMNNNVDKPDANKLYVVMMPPGVRSDVDYGYSKADNKFENLSGGGYHESFALNGVQVHYAVIESSLSAAGDARLSYVVTDVVTGKETSFEHLTEVLSHELVEAISDAEPNSQPAWKGTGTLKGSEIGDITDYNPPTTGIDSTVDGYRVEKYWSETAGTSVAPGGVDYAPMTQVPTNLNGRIFTLTALQQGPKASAQLQFSYVTISTTPGLSNFDGYWQGTDGKLVNMVGTLQVSGGRSLNMIVKRASDNVVLFTGTLSTPNGDWGSGLEISPEKTADAQFFGVEGGGSIDPSGPAGYVTAGSSAGSVDWNYVTAAYPPITKHKGPYTWA